MLYARFVREGVSVLDGVRRALSQFGRVERYHEFASVVIAAHSVRKYRGRARMRDVQPAQNGSRRLDVKFQSFFVSVEFVAFGYFQLNAICVSVDVAVFDVGVGWYPRKRRFRSSGKNIILGISFVEYVARAVEIEYDGLAGIYVGIFHVYRITAFTYRKERFLRGYRHTVIALHVAFAEKFKRYRKHRSRFGRVFDVIAPYRIIHADRKVVEIILHFRPAVGAVSLERICRVETVIHVRVFGFERYSERIDNDGF